jgi:hypothetical protein
VAQRIEDGLSAPDENVNTQEHGKGTDRIAGGISNNAREVHREYMQNEKMLNKLAEEQAAVDLAIRQRELRREQVLKSLENEADELSRPSAPIKSLMSTDPHAAAEQRDFEEPQAKIGLAKIDAEKLFEGLKGLVGISSIEIKPSGSRRGVQLEVEVGSLGATLLLDGERRLVDISITRGSYPHVTAILSEAITQTTPQDLRYAIFALGAVQRSAAALGTHIADLRKRCIVRSHGFTTTNSCASVQVTLSNGVTASLSAHACYPELPGGVSIDSLVGVGGWSMQELEAIRVTANAKCFCSLPDMMEHLITSTDGR